jgi:hypothetical protein
MSTLPNRKLVLTRAWIVVLSKSLSYAAPARAKMSPAPVQSTVTRASTAKRPSLLSHTTPRTGAPGPSVTAATAQLWKSTCTVASRTMSLETHFMTSGSTVGAQLTTPRWAEARTLQYATASLSREPHSSGGGPSVASHPQRSISSCPTPATTRLPSQSVMRSIQNTSPPVASPPRWP